MRQVNLVEFTELLQHGVHKLGYDWNTLNDILLEDNICPMYEAKSQEHGLPTEEETLEEYNSNMGTHWSEDTFKVMMSFAVEHNVCDSSIVVIEG